jgi:hypothetical protein
MISPEGFDRQWSSRLIAMNARRQIYRGQMLTRDSFPRNNRSRIGIGNDLMTKPASL